MIIFLLLAQLILLGNFIIKKGDLKIPNLVLDTFQDVKKVTQCELDERVVVNCLKYFEHSEKL